MYELEKIITKFEKDTLLPFFSDEVNIGEYAPKQPKDRIDVLWLGGDRYKEIFFLGYYPSRYPEANQAIYPCGKNLLFEIFGNQDTHLDIVNRAIRRHPVDGGGDCAYTAFGITQVHAYQLLVDNVNSIQDRISPIVKQLLFENDRFRDYLRENQYLDSNITNATLLEDLNSYAQDLHVLQEYINFDLQKRELENQAIIPQQKAD